MRLRCIANSVHASADHARQMMCVCTSHRLVSGYHVPSGIVGSPSSARSDLALQAAELSRASCLLGTSCARAGASPTRRGVPMAAMAALAGCKMAKSSLPSWAEPSLTTCVSSTPSRTAWSPSGRMPAARHAAPSHASGRLQTCPHIDSIASSLPLRCSLQRHLRRIPVS